MKIALPRMDSLVHNTIFDSIDPLEVFSQIPFECNQKIVRTPGKTNKNEKQERSKQREKKKSMLNCVSRQRRAANDRERRRNVRLNQAFVTLKKALPLANIDISKIEILRLAVKWIDHLTTLLKDYEQHRDLLTLRHSCSGEYITDSQNGKSNHMRYDCLYHQDPDLKNTLWEDCIGLPSRSIISFILCA